MKHSKARSLFLCRILMILGAVSVWSGDVDRCQAAIIYVNSRSGDNRLDGRAPEPLNTSVGPVRSLQRALQLVRRGDSIVLVNNNTPYYGSISLVGERWSGTPNNPFRIIGNGAVLSGAKPILPSSWNLVGADLWRVTPLRKGHALLLRDEQPVPEVSCTEADMLGMLPEGHWCLWDGAVYYRATVTEYPPNLPFALADEEVGITLLDVHDVEISHLVVRHYRLDGINLHDRCHHVRLTNVVCEQNGRAGVTVAGSSQAELVDVHLRENREHAVLETELGVATILGSEIGQAPVVEQVD